MQLYIGTIKLFLLDKGMAMFCTVGYCNSCDMQELTKFPNFANKKLSKKSICGKSESVRMFRKRRIANRWKELAVSV